MHHKHECNMHHGRLAILGDDAPKRVATAMQGMHRPAIVALACSQYCDAVEARGS